MMQAPPRPYITETERLVAAEKLRDQSARGEVDPDLAAYFLARLEDLKSPLIRFAPLGSGEGPFLTPDERTRLAAEIRQELDAGTLPADSRRAQLLPALENVFGVPLVWRSDMKTVPPRLMDEMK
jgi:hypothetical protein